MIKINLRKIIIFVAVCVAIVLVVSFGTREKNYYLANRVLKELPTTFKAGDDLSKVIAYLDRNKLDRRSGFRPIINGHIEDSRLKNDKYIEQGASNYLSVLIPDVTNYGITPGGGELIAFYFDKKNKLMGCVSN